MSISYSIRKWAANNIHLARGIIVFATILLFFLSHLIGVLAEELGVDMNAMFLVGTGTAILAWTLVPRKGEEFPIRYTYTRQQVAIALMLMSSCIGVGGAAICIDRFEHPTHTHKQVQSNNVKAVLGYNFSSKAKVQSRTVEALSNWFRGGVSKKATSVIRKVFKNIVPKKKSAAGTILATIMSLFLAIALSYGLLLLSCSISCSGHEVLAIVVAIGGLSLIILGLIKVLNIIYIDPNKKRVKRTNMRSDS